MGSSGALHAHAENARGVTALEMAMEHVALVWPDKDARQDRFGYSRHNQMMLAPAAPAEERVDAKRRSYSLLRSMCSQARATGCGRLEIQGTPFDPCLHAPTPERPRVECSQAVACGACTCMRP